MEEMELYLMINLYSLMKLEDLKKEILLKLAKLNLLFILKNNTL